MIYYIILTIATSLVAVVILRIRQLRPTQLNPVAIGNQLLRQPERFFIIVPWLLYECKNRNINPLNFSNEVAMHWKKSGNFKLQANTLTAFAQLQKEPSHNNLKHLLTLLSIEDDKMHPIVIAANESYSEGSLPVKCLKNVNLITKAEMQGKKKTIPELIKPAKAVKAHELATKIEKQKSIREKIVFGNFNDKEILDEWLSLLKFTGTRIDPYYESRSGWTPASQGKKKKKRRHKKKKAPQQHSYSHPYLWYIEQAIKLYKDG